MTNQTQHRYIVQDEQILGGEPIIEEKRPPVRAVVELRRQDIAPDNIPHRLPHLTPAQIFDALSYYSDHQPKINGHIERNRTSESLLNQLVRES